jgi:hypothetical protein
MFWWQEIVLGSGSQDNPVIRTLLPLCPIFAGCCTSGWRGGVYVRCTLVLKSKICMTVALHNVLGWHGTTLSTVIFFWFSSVWFCNALRRWAKTISSLPALHQLWGRSALHTPSIQSAVTTLPSHSSPCPFLSASHSPSKHPQVTHLVNLKGTILYLHTTQLLGGRGRG